MCKQVCRVETVILQLDLNGSKQLTKHLELDKVNFTDDPSETKLDFPRVPF